MFRADNIHFSSDHKSYSGKHMVAQLMGQITAEVAAIVLQDWKLTAGDGAGKPEKINNYNDHSLMVSVILHFIYLLCSYY